MTARKFGFNARANRSFAYVRILITLAKVASPAGWQRDLARDDLYRLAFLYDLRPRLGTVFSRAQVVIDRTGSSCCGAWLDRSLDREQDFPDSKHRGPW